MPQDPTLPFPTVSSPSSSQQDAESSDNQETVETLLKKNIALGEAVYLQNKKIQRRLTWMVVGNYLRLLLIFVPLVLAIFYIPKLMDDFMATLDASGNTDTEAMMQEMMQLFMSR